MNSPERRERNMYPRINKGLSIDAGAMKRIAIIAMFIDHMTLCFLEVAIFCDNPHGKDVDLDYYIVILFSYQTLYHTDLHEMIPHLTNLYSNKNVIYFRRVVTR